MAGKKPPMSFLDLPAELRNEIYDLLLIRSSPIVLHDTHPGPNRNNRRVRSHTKSRIETASEDHARPRGQGGMSAYCLDKCLCPEPLNTVLLRVNQQIRTEALPVFYAKNVFSFRDIGTLIPFIKSQSEAAQVSVQNLELHFNFGKGALLVSQPPIESDDFHRICSGLRSLETLKSQKVSILIHDRGGHFMRSALCGKVPGWMESLSENIRDLDFLGFAFQGPDCLMKSDHPRSHEFLDIVDEQLWEFLAPRMLKQVGNDHNAESLHNRRVHCGMDEYHDGGSKEQV